MRARIPDSVLVYLWRVLPLPERVRWYATWRGNAHFTAGASALIVDDEGRVLLFKHTYRGRHPWGLPGGWIRRNEGPEGGLTRELREESGLDIAVDGIAQVDLHAARRHIDLLYHCHVTGGAFRSSAEVTEHRYFAPDALPDLGYLQARRLARVLRSQRPVARGQ